MDVFRVGEVVVPGVINFVLVECDHIFNSILLQQVYYITPKYNNRER
jgi:hypothetical protein